MCVTLSILTYVRVYFHWKFSKELCRDRFGYKNQLCFRSKFHHYVRNSYAISKREVVDHGSVSVVIVDNPISIQRSVA